MNIIIKISCLIMVALIGYGCVTPQGHAQAVAEANPSGDKLTAGKVQREIRIGMANGEVIEVLGSPNLVSTDPERREIWTYDRVSTYNVYSSSQGGVGSLLLGGAPVGAGVLGGGVSGGASYSSGANASGQRTLTIIIKFDQNGRVRDFSYRQSSF